MSANTRLTGLEQSGTTFILKTRDKSGPKAAEAPYFFNPRREVLNEQLAQVVQGLEFAGLETKDGGEEGGDAA